MLQERAPDELAIVLGRVRRFFASWLVLLTALAAAPVTMAVLLELVALVALEAGWDDGQLYAHPLALSVFWAWSAVWAGIVVGAPVVLLRRHIVRPDPPYLRIGYIGVVAAPFVLAIGAGEVGPGWYVLPAYVQIVLLLAALIYVALARRFRLFEPEEWRDRRT